MLNCVFTITFEAFLQSMMEGLSNILIDGQKQIKLSPIVFNTGADLVGEDYKGRQCAQLAAMRNHKKVLQLLFDHGVDLDCRCENGKTPVHYAAQFGCKKIYVKYKTNAEDSTLPCYSFNVILMFCSILNFGPNKSVENSELNY